MSARTVIESISDETGVMWDDNSVIEILCRYIDNQQDERTFQDYVQRQADEETAECDDEEG